MKHIPRKRFGQHFLTDNSVLHELVHAILPQQTDCMIEIGPGLGAMTKLLLPYLDQLHVVELDRDLAAQLKKIFDVNRLVVHEADALAFDFTCIPCPIGKKRRIVGNLPYNISTPLLFHLATCAHEIVDQHFMLQKEVVERMVASPGSRLFGRLSVMLQWRYDMAYLFTVPPSAFNPPPRVDSAVVRMRPKAAPLMCSYDCLEKVVAQAFSQRRKIIKNTLHPLLREVQLEETGIDPSLRPEAISVEGYVALANVLEEVTRGSHR